MITPDFRVPDCPVFRPSPAEWAGDPFAYIRGVVAAGAQGNAGIAKIVPPPGWRVPFSLPHRDAFAFTPRVQVLNSLEAVVRASAQFITDLRLFHFVEGHPLSPPLPVREMRGLRVFERLLVAPFRAFALPPAHFAR